MAREKEETLKRQLAEEREIAEDRLRKREALLREQMLEDQERYNARLADLKRELNQEREKGYEQIRYVDELKAQLAHFRSGQDAERARLEEEVNARLREREEDLRRREAEVAELQRFADQGREGRAEEEFKKRAEEFRRREQELLAEVEQLRAQIKANRDKADASEGALHEELTQVRRAANDTETQLRARVQQAEQDTEHQKSMLAREQADHEEDARRHAEDKAAAEKLRKDLEEQLAAERQKLINEREQWEKDMNAERECLNNLMELELGRQKQELTELHEARMEVLRQQLEDAKAVAQVAPSPPAIRRPTQIVTSKSRPQPQPPGEETPRRPFPSPATPVHTPLGQSDDSRNNAILRELEAARHQNEGLRQRIEDLNEEIDILRKREKDRIAGEVDDANKRINELRKGKGSLEEAKTDVERKLREVTLVMNEQSLQSKKAERMSAAELQDLKDNHHDEMKRAQARYRDLEDQLRQAQDQMRALQDQIRDAERALGDERGRGTTKYSEAQLQHQVGQLTAEVNTLRQQLARRSEELAAKAVELAAAQGELTAKTSEMLNLQSKISALDDKTESLQKSLQDREALVKTQAELAAAEQEKTDELVRIFEAKCNEHQMQLEQLQALLHRRQEELDIATIEAGGVRRDVDALRAENSRLREELFSTRDHLRKELEALRDESQALERRAFSAEREAAVQREHADGLQHVLSERSTLESEGRKAATDAMAEAAERELDRLRHQLSTKTDQLLMKDRKEEALNAKLSALLAEIIPGEEHEDPTQEAIDKLREWKAWVAKAQIVAASQREMLKKKMEQLKLAILKLQELKLIKRKLMRSRKQVTSLRHRLSRTSRKRSGPRRALIKTSEASLLRPQSSQLHAHQQASATTAATTSTPSPTNHVTYATDPSPSRSARVPLPTKSLLGERRTELSPPPPTQHYGREVVSPQLTSPLRHGGGPSVEQIEEMLTSMEALIHQPLPGTEPRHVSPRRLDAHGRPMEIPPPQVRSVRLASMSPRLPHEPSARELLDAHERSRRRREERVDELNIILGRLAEEIQDLRVKEADLVTYRERTVATIEEQQASLLNDVNYWRGQLGKYEQLGAQDEAVVKCHTHIQQSEQDLMVLVRQKPEMLVKAEQGQSHLQSEIIRCSEQRAVIDAELLHLTAEVQDLRQKEAALHSLTSPHAVAPPAAHLPPALPVPPYASPDRLM